MNVAHGAQTLPSAPQMILADKIAPSLTRLRDRPRRSLITPEYTVLIAAITSAMLPTAPIVAMGPREQWS